MGIMSLFSPYKTHIFELFYMQPISSLHHGYNYSYLMLTNFIGSSYKSHFFCKNAAHIELCIGIVFMSAVCVFLFRALIQIMRGI